MSPDSEMPLPPAIDEVLDETQAMLDHAGALAGVIGPRGTGTPQEQAAADYAADCLQAWGVPFERLACRTILSMNHYPISINVLGLAAFALYPLAGAPGRWLAAALALLVFPFMALTVRASGNPLRRFLPKTGSPSVLGCIHPAGVVESEAVILSHLDTNKCRLTWKPERRRTLEPLTITTLAVQAFFGLLYLGGAISGQTFVPWVLSFIPAVYMLSIVITLIIDDFTPYSPGANDNAAAVGLNLSLARHFAAQPLQHTRLWLAFTGAEETDHYGLRSVLEAHPFELRRALFIDLEGVGAGDLVYVTRHGIGLHYHPDPALVQLAAQVAAEHPEWQVQGRRMVVSEEVSTLTYLGCRALCISGVDKATGGLCQWHQAEDTVENLQAPALTRSRAYTLAILHALDEGRLQKEN